MQHPNFTRKPDIFSWELETELCENHEFVMDDREHLCEIYQPKLVVNLEQYNLVNEVTYKDIASGIDNSFLRQGERSKALSAPQLAGFEHNLMNWRVPSADFSTNRIVYLDQVQFDDWDEVGQDQSLNWRERAMFLLWASNIRLHCTCPSFLYWGYQYILTVFDAAIHPETTRPGKYPDDPRRRRNYQEKGIVCKHLNRVLQVLPFHNMAIAQELRSQFGG